MSTRTDLEKAYNNYFRELFEKLKFEQFSEYSSGMGSVRYFKNVRLKVQLVNDRGIIDLLITGIDSEDYKDAELIFSWLILQKADINSTTKTERKKILTTRRGFSEQSHILKKLYSDIVEKFNSKNFNQTLKSLNKIGSERSKYYW